MKTFFTSERFGSPQIIAALLLLAFLLQCVWLINRTLHATGGMNPIEQERIHEGLRQWHGKAIAGTRDTNAAANSSFPYNGLASDTVRSPLWYLIASAPLVGAPAQLGPHRIYAWGWLARAPYLLFGLLLGASLWYVARRL